MSYAWGAVLAYVAVGASPGRIADRIAKQGRSRTSTAGRVSHALANSPLQLCPLPQKRATGNVIGYAVS